jgi:histidine triad (HIT) family protein
MNDDCLFCKMALGTIPVDKLYEDNHLFAIDDIHPRAPVHFMVIPREHIATLADVTAVQSSLLFHMVEVANELAEKKGVAKRGYRVVINVGSEGGQAIFHLHMHVLGGRPLRAEG